MRNHSGVLWMDASVRLTTGDITPAISKARNSGGIAVLTLSYTSVYSITHPMVYAYLPTNITKAKYQQTAQSGFLLVYKTREIYQHVLKWFVLCSLTSHCIAPTYRATCNFTDFYLLYGGCSRFDQSVLNVLLSNYFNYNISRYHVKNRIARVIKSPTNLYTLQTCEPN